MIKEVEIRKKKGLSRFLNNAPDIRDFVFFPPLPPPPLLPPPNFSNPRPPPPPSHLFDIPNALRVDKFLNNNDFKFDFSNGYVPPAPDTPLLREFARHFFPNGPSPAKTSSNVGTNTAKTSSNVGTNLTQTISGDCLIEELEMVIEKEKLKEEIVPDENIIFSLPKQQYQPI